MDDEEAADFKKRAKLATRKWRVNKSRSLATPLTAIENEIPYKSLSSFGKARKRVENALPRKKAAVVRKLASDILNIEVKGPSSVTTADYSCVTNFYNNDSISLVMPGKADIVTVYSNSSKIEMQNAIL